MMRFLVTWDIATTTNPSHMVRLHREIQRACVDLDIQRVGGSVYLVSSDEADLYAHIIAELATACGAGQVGEPNGPMVIKLSEESADAYFRNKGLARQVVNELLLDHRVKRNKSKSRSIASIISDLCPRYSHPNIIDLTRVLHERNEWSKYDSGPAELLSTLPRHTRQKQM